MDIRPVTISLFAGAGGCSLGFKRAGYNIVYAVDNDTDAVATYNLNFPGTICDLADIRNIDWLKLMTRLDLEQGDLDMLIGGPPCQGFSTAGMRFWDDPRNALLRAYVAALKNLRPKWFLMENVEGLLTAKSGDYVFEATKAFIELGYTLRIQKVYAQEYGIPQRRKRVVVIGNSLGCDFDIPDPVVKATGSIFRNGAVTLRDAIESLPNPANKPEVAVKYTIPAKTDLERDLQGTCSGVKDHFSPILKDLQYQRASSLLPGQTMKNLPEELQHASFMRRANRRVMDGTPSEKRGGAPSGLKRLHYDEPCLTITGAATRELIHPSEHRPLTIRECARVQTFPDTFCFEGRASQRIQQIGNAIPPMLAEMFGAHLLKYGFNIVQSNAPGRLLGISLTKTSAMSPALAHTRSRLLSLTCRNQPSLF